MVDYRLALASMVFVDLSYVGLELSFTSRKRYEASSTVQIRPNMGSIPSVKLGFPPLKMLNHPYRKDRVYRQWVWSLRSVLEGFSKNLLLLHGM